MIRVENVHKTFVLHQQHGVRLPVLADASLTVNAGECVVLHGHSGSGKSTLLRSLYANYLPDSGHIHIRHGDEWVDLVTATPRKVLEVRKTTIGWVSQFLRVIPRISALEVVMQPLLDLGTPREASAAKAAQLLTRLNVPERLWHLAPSTFSGGEQQRVNIARGLRSTIRSCSLMNPPPHWMAKQCCRGQPDPRCQSARRGHRGDFP